jgi:hypothetical protein
MTISDILQRRGFVLEATRLVERLAGVDEAPQEYANRQPMKFLRS